MKFPEPGIDTGECSEDDVVALFRAGLEAFMTTAGGTFGSRRVTQRQEKQYPSDQDYALRFDNPAGFELHLFGLQFKRWKSGKWGIDEPQRTNLSQLAHVVAYCLPRRCRTVPPNALHAFYLVNPSCVPAGTSALELLPFVDHRHGDENWSHQRLVAHKKDSSEENLPRLCWGEFFDAVRAGSTIVEVPGDPARPPGSDDPPVPDRTTFGRGIGLTVVCNGGWGSAWARHQITEHVRFWGQRVMAAPAAVIAFESFSRSMDFTAIGVTGGA